jgi:O-antigen ligase
VSEPHNFVLQTLGETGIVGFCCWRARWGSGYSP